MTSRFFRTEISWDEYAERLPLAVPSGIEAPEPTYNAAPRSMQPVLRLDRERTHIELAPCIWGLVPSWWTKPIQERKFSGISVDARQAEQRPVYRGAFRHWRCLIPVSGFYIWAGEGRAKQPFAVAMADRSWFCLAGLWDTALIDGSVLETFTVLTTEPNDLLAGLTTQMPVIVGREDDFSWLDPRRGDPDHLFEPYMMADMHVWPVGPDVGNVRNNHSGLIEEA